MVTHSFYSQLFSERLQTTNISAWDEIHFHDVKVKLIQLALYYLS